MSDELLQIGEHSFVPALLPDAPLVVDVGCRDFGFSRGILELRPKAHILALDPDPAVVDPSNDPRIEVMHVALIGERGVRRRWFDVTRGGECNALTTPYVNDSIQVRCVRIEGVLNGQHADLVKFDCEGAEFEILGNWPGPIATQLSIEFHDYNDWLRWDAEYFEYLFSHQLKDYRVVQHPYQGIGPEGRDLGHWNSVLVLK